MCRPGQNLRRGELSPQDGQPLSLTAFNPDYGFSISREPPRKAWNVTAMKFGDGHEAATAGVRETNAGVTPEQAALTLVSFLNVEFIPVERLLTDATFRASSVAPDGERLRIDFASDVESLLGPSRVVGGTLWLLPASHHVLDEYRVEVIDFDKSRVSVNLKMIWRETGARPVPASSRAELPDYKPQPIVMTREFANWSYTAPADESVFRLSHYGLSEPMLPAPPVNYTWYYVAAGILGALLVTAGILIRRRNR